MIVVGTLTTGGMERVNTVLANKLGETNDVFLYTIRGDKDSFYPLTVPLLKNNKTENSSRRLNILRLSGLLRLKFINQWIYKNEAAKVIKIIEKETPDTIIFNAENVLCLPFVKKAFPEINYISWLHNNANTYLTRVFKGIKSDFIKSLAQSNKVVSLTDEDKDIFKIFNEDTIAIPNPLTIDNHEISTLDTKIISWTGRIAHPMKGIDYLAEIASRLPDDWRISVAGSGNDKLFDKYINKYHSKDKIIRQGSLIGERLKAHYLDSSIYLMTSRWEGFPLVLAEAMSFGLPIVAFEQSGSNEVLKAGDTGVLIKNGDVEEIVQALLELIADKDKRIVYQKKSLERVKDFDRDTIVKQWEAIL